MESEKKNDVKKLIIIYRSWDGLLPNSQAWSRYSRLYRDTAGVGAQGMGHDTARAQPRHDRACATIRRDTAQRSHAGSLASGVCHDTILCIVTGGAGLASRHSAPRAAIRRSTPCDTVQRCCDMQGSACGACAARALCRDTIFVSRVGGCDTTGGSASTR